MADPRSSACATSLGVMAPRLNGMPAATATSATSGRMPGVTRKCAPASMAWRAWSAVSTVPTPTTAPWRSAVSAARRMCLSTSGVVKVSSTARMPPSASAWLRSAAAGVESARTPAKVRSASSRRTKSSGVIGFGGSFRGAAQGTAGPGARGLAVVDRCLAVDEHIVDSGSRLPGVLEGGFVPDGLRVEEHDVGRVAFANEAPPVQLEPRCGTSGEVVHHVLKPEQPEVTGVVAEVAREGAPRPGMRLGPDQQAIASAGVGAVLHDGLHIFLVAHVLQDARPQAIADQYVHEDLERRVSRFGRDGGYGLADVVR